MTEGPGFAETITALLGTPHDRPAELIGFVVVAMAMLAWVAVEQGFAALVVRLLRRSRPKRGG
ncbi:MAG TPA: hypothetical protein VFQ67_06680 [Allosphingosinicella sp.]|jgi:hypothetical protein|nr:hypothetical protein [Allosphingosinicella sp.]